MFVTDLDVRADLTADDQWILLADLKWQGEQTYVVPKNFRTDLASIPRGLRWALKQNGRSRRAGCLHDFLYRNGLLARKACDQLFVTALIADGVTAVGRWLYYAGVRAGGWAPFNKYERERLERELAAALSEPDYQRSDISEL